MASPLDVTGKYITEPGRNWIGLDS